MKCPNCGTDLPKGAGKCPSCGAGIVRGKYCPHCRAVIPLDAKTCPQCKKSIPADNGKKPLTKRWWFWTVAAVLVIGIIGNIGNAINPGKAAPASSAVSSQAPITNPFLLPEVEVQDVNNGVRTEKIGEWACIHMKKADAKAASEEDFSKFAETRVQGSDYKWWSIIFEDGTGIQFTGSHTYVSTYGQLDDEGCISQAMGDISLEKSSSHTSYTARQEKPSPSPTPEPTPEPSSSATKAPTSPPAQVPASTPAPQETPSLETPQPTKKPVSGNSAADGTPSQHPAGHTGNGNNFDTYDNPDQQQTSANYVLNTSSMKFHYPTCSSVKKIAPQNYADFTGTRDEAIAAGYSPCGKCNP